MKSAPRPTKPRLRIARCPNCDQIPDLHYRRNLYHITCKNYSRLGTRAQVGCIGSQVTEPQETATKAASLWNAKQRRHPKNPQRATATIQ